MGGPIKEEKCRKVGVGKSDSEAANEKAEKIPFEESIRVPSKSKMMSVTSENIDELFVLD